MNYRLIDEVRAMKPLVHHITNDVTVNECANITLNLGALPIMAPAIEEVEEMVACAGALVLNIGTLTPEQVDSMIKAGKRANELGIPVVLDPVGAGATKLRTESAERILREVSLTAIKGNGAEISILAGKEAEIKGVESITVSSDIVSIARSFAKQSGAIVVVSGKEDIVTDGDSLFLVKNGCEMMGKLVGTGCMAASAIGSFLGLKGNRLEAVIAGLASYEIAAEIAAARSDVKGPGTFRAALMDEARNLTGEAVENRIKIEVCQ